MKYIKSVKFWILFFVGLYSILGFFILPWIISAKFAVLAKEKAGINIQVGDSFFNPYSFELHIKDILLQTIDKKPALKVDEIYVNYSPLALFDKIISFQTFRITNPQIFALLDKNGKINFENIIPVSDEKKQTTSSSEEELPKIVLQQFEIEKGSFYFKDEKKDFDLNLGPYSFQAYDISTQEGNINSYKFDTTLEDGGSIFWEGGFSLKPLSLYGELNIQELQLPKLYKYAVHVIPSSLHHGKVSLKIPYQVNLENKLQAKISHATINLKALTLTYEDEDIIDISNIDINDINLEYPAQKVSIKDVLISRPTFVAILNKDNSVNFQDAFKSTSLEESKDTTQNKAWEFLLKEAKIQDARVKFFDNSKDVHSYFELSDMNIDVANISSDKSKLIDYDIFTKINTLSSLKLNGNFNQESLHVKSKIVLENLKLNFFENYISEFVNIKLQDGDIDFDADVEASLQENMSVMVDANTYINKLLINSKDDEKLLSWNKFSIKDINYNHALTSLNIGSFALQEPFVRLAIAKDGSTNFSNLSTTSKEEEPEKKVEKKSDFKLRVGPMKLTDAKADFSDLSLPFPFRTQIHDLNGDFSELDFQKSTPSNLKLEGKIDKYGYANIKGEIVPLDIKKHANIDVMFKNINLNSLTPYSGKFLGRKIESGKLSMDLKYVIDKSSLKGSNKLNLDTFTLGERIEQEGALDLPLDLALALLKDSNNQIDIDLPVAGDMNNPEFSYGSIIWKAIGNMITGLVTAPFRFLGNLLGIDGEKLKSIDFALGSKELIITEHEKLVNLEKILGKRPGIKLAIKGSFDKTLDTKALQNQELKKVIEKEQAKIKDKKADTYSLVLKALYIKTNSEEKYEKLEKTFIDKKSKKLDIVSFNKTLTQSLSEGIIIEEAKLLDLADKRAQVVKDTLVNKYKIAQERISIQKPESSTAKREQWIEVKLDIQS